MERTDHDRLFKELLGLFFLDFVALFLPEVAEGIEPGSLVRLDKELFHDVAAGERLEADLVVQARLKGETACFIIHVEHQAQASGELPLRMFRYYTRLRERFTQPVYPIALLSYDKPKRPAPTMYEEAFMGRSLLRFNYTVVQLNRLNWRDFLEHPNPVASALMSRMGFVEHEKPRVVLECLRMLATLRLVPARNRLISGFVDTYIRLEGEQLMTFEREARILPAPERERVMELSNPWIRIGHRDGLEEGRRQGELSLAMRLLQKRFGELGEGRIARLRALELEQLETLAEAIFELDSLEALNARFEALGST